MSINNTETNKRLNEIIVDAIEFVDKTGTHISEQAPIVVEEFLAWRLFQHATYTGLFLALMLVIGIILLFMYKNRSTAKEKLHYSDYAFIFHTCPFILVLGAIGLFAATIYHSMICVKIIIAPRIYIIEELAKLITGGV